MTLPWHNPILLVEQAATLDLVSDGRLDFGIGKGHRYNEFNGFDIDMADAAAIFEEAFSLILKAWQNEERWSHQGARWQFNDIVVEPPVVQKPHPPIWLAAGRPQSIRAAARSGAHLLLDQYSPLKVALEHADIFRDELATMGVDPAARQIALARRLFIAKNQAEKAAVIERRTKSRGLVDELAQTPEGDNSASIMQFKGPEEAIDDALIWTLDEIQERLDAIRAGGTEGIRTFLSGISLISPTVEMRRQLFRGTTRRNRPGGETALGQPSVVHQDGSGDTDINAEFGRDSHHVVATRYNFRRQLTLFRA